MALRDEVISAMCKSGSVGETFDEKHPFHHKNYEDNLYCPLSGNALEAYQEGSGNETKAYWRNGKLCPPKMASVASSSAMTFNLLGKDPVTVPTGKGLPGGTYEVQYEKQMYTLKTAKIPANLDAFLSNEADKTAIFCEMKMLEWLNQPGVLRSSYQEENAWFATDNDAVSCSVNAYKVFAELRGKIAAEGLKRYDVWQMFKHLLAIYNYTSFTTQKAVDGFRGTYSMAGKYDRIILVNVVNEFPPERIVDAATQAEYMAALQEEQNEADCFVDMIRNSELPRLFDNNCSAGMEVKYMSAKDFAACLDMSQAKRDYLKRYFT